MPSLSQSSPVTRRLCLNGLAGGVGVFLVMVDAIASTVASANPIQQASVVAPNGTLGSEEIYLAQQSQDALQTVAPPPVGQVQSAQNAQKVETQTTTILSAPPSEVAGQSTPQASPYGSASGYQTEADLFRHITASTSANQTVQAQQAPAMGATMVAETGNRPNPGLSPARLPSNAIATPTVRPISQIPVQWMSQPVQQPTTSPIYQAPTYQVPGQQAQVYQAPVYQPQGQQAQIYQAPVQQAPIYQTPYQPQGQQIPIYQPQGQQAQIYQAPYQTQGQIYQAPMQQGPVYQAPYQAPIYQAPGQQAQVYQSPVYQPQGQQVQIYQAPYQAQGQIYQAPMQQGPVYQAPYPVQGQQIPVYQAPGQFYPAPGPQAAPVYQAPGIPPGYQGQPQMGQAPGQIQPAEQGTTQVLPPATTIQPTPIPVLPRERRLLDSTALTPPAITLQGALLYYDSETSARARLAAIYPLTPGLLVGGTLDFNTGNALGEEGVNVNELYLAAALPGLPSFRIIAGQMDLTSYFDRNSFAKDSTTQFFNPIFQTNPALAAANIGSRPGILVNWSLTDDLEARAVAFSSARAINDFAFDGFAGEIGFRVGDAIIRGTYVSSRDTNASDTADSDRQEAYGVNAEWFIPALNLGLFGRYGRLNNQADDFSADTFSAGLNVLDVFSRNDRLGIAYGRNLSDELARRQNDGKVPDALELFYDMQVLPNLRLGFSIQQVDDFSETIAGFRVRTEFDVTPRGSLGQ